MIETKTETTTEESIDQIDEQQLKNHIESNIEKGICSVNPAYIKKHCPLSYKKLQTFLMSKVQIEIDEDIVYSFLIYNAYPVTNFFDENDIFINISGDHDTWRYYITSHTVVDNTYPNRAKALSEALTRAFEIMESNINE